MPNRRVLVVDDDDKVRQLYAQGFARAGYEAHDAPGGREALEMMRRQAFPVVFSDLKMPGMNGLELCRAIRVHWPMTIVMAVTGYASLFELNECREAGFEDYFTKPVRMQELLNAAVAAFAKHDRWRQR